MPRAAKKKYESELGTWEQRGGVYDSRERCLAVCKTRLKMWMNWRCSLLAAGVPASLNKVLHWRSEENARKKNNQVSLWTTLLTTGLQMHVFKQKCMHNEIFESLRREIGAYLKTGIAYTKEILGLVSGQQSGHNRTWQLSDCWIAVVTTVQSCVIYQQDTSILDKAKRKLLRTANNWELGNIPLKQ